MIKLYALLVPRDGMSAVAFHEHWREVHGPLAGRIRRARAYVQCHRLACQPDDLPILPHGGTAEVWFDDYESAQGLAGDPDYSANAGRDEDNFHHMERMTVLHAHERIVFEAAPVHADTGGVKVMQFVRRRAGDSPADFRRAWLADAAGDSSARDHLRVSRHVRTAAVPECYEQAEPAFDGVRELWWPDEWSFRAARLRAPSAWEALTGDPAIERSASGFLVTVENRVVWPVQR